MTRKFTRILAALALLVFMTPSLAGWGQTRDIETFTFSELGYGNAEDVTTVVGDDVTLTFDAGSNANNSPKYYNTGSGVRMYTGNTLEVALNDQTGDTRITAIDFTFSGTTYSGGLQNWTGSETSHTFTATSNARIQVIAVTFSEGGTAPTTYTVTYYANVTGTAPVVDTYVEGADVTLRDANTFTNDGYTFSEWNTDADGDGDAYDAGDVIEDIQDNIELYAIWTENPVSDDHWVLTELADLTSSDVFVIVGNNGSNYAMSNDKGTSNPPTAVAVTVTGNEITSTVAANIQWNISGDATNGYTFYPNGSTTTWLYCTAANNGVRVGGTNNNKTFGVDGGYLKHYATSRYVGIYNSQDWRCYTNTTSNIAGQTFAFYKKMTGALPPSIIADDVEIAYDATSGEIVYTLNNPATNGSLSVSENVDWISNPVLSTTENKVTFEATANEATTAREGIITITYTYGDNETVSKDVTVTQAAAPVIYTTIPDLFAAATGTETSVLVTFNNWVVSGVSTNGKNVFVTDNNGNGFMIYYTTDMSSTFAAGNILSGTAVSCTLKKYNGFAELLNVTATDLTITSGGTVTVADIAMADLTGVNTGALLHYDNLTCSVDNNKYYLSDGTTSIQVYNAIYAFGTLVEGKHYNITGIYQQYNNTKEILPRSAEDIEEVEVQHEEYTLTVSDLSHVNLFIFGGEESETIISTEDGETTAQVYDGTEVLVSIDVESGYVFQSLTITDGNGDPVNMEELTANEYYSFVMPVSDVTITASAEVLTGDQYELFTGDELVEGDYLIVYNGKAMNNTVNSNRLQYAEVIATNNVITTDNDAIVWHIAPSDDYWTIYSADANAYAASTGTKNQATTMADGTNDKALWTASGSETYEFVNKYNSENNVNSNLRNNGTYGFACYASTTGGALSLYKKVEDTPVTETYTMTLTADKWYLIASPVEGTVTTNAMEVSDLFFYDEQNHFWKNKKLTANASGFDFANGKGYLCGNQNSNFELTFEGTASTDDIKEIPLSYHATTAEGENNPLAGWNLVGNPFATTAEISNDYYIMNGAGNGLIAGEDNIIDAMQGVFVQATPEDQSVIFQKAEESVGGGDDKLVVNLSQNRGYTIDRAIVRFGEGHQLPKFQLFEDNAKLYIPQNGMDYAIVRTEAQGELPVNFRAAENGTYTLSMDVENVVMNYLHLIDNMTGMDVDLLQTPSYTFEATTRDYESRFKLVFAGASANAAADETFAFFSNGSLIVSNEGEATLQVVDLTGRILSSQSINGSCSTNIQATPGVYMLRLINGDNVKVQKIVVR